MKLAHKLMLATAIILSGCNKPPETVADLQSTLEGRWVFNSAYCQQLYPDDGLIDHLIENDGIRTGGVLAKGQWYRPALEDSERYAGQIESYLADNRKTCKEALPSSKPMFIVFESFEQKFALAYFHDSDSVFRIEENRLVAGRRYDGEALRQLRHAD